MRRWRRVNAMMSSTKLSSHSPIGRCTSIGCSGWPSGRPWNRRVMASVCRAGGAESRGRRRGACWAGCRRPRRVRPPSPGAGWRGGPRRRGATCPSRTAPRRCRGRTPACRRGSRRRRGRARRRTSRPTCANVTCARVLHVVPPQPEVEQKQHGGDDVEDQVIDADPPGGLAGLDFDPLRQARRARRAGPRCSPPAMHAKLVRTKRVTAHVPPARQQVEQQGGGPQPGRQVDDRRVQRVTEPFALEDVLEPLHRDGRAS